MKHLSFNRKTILVILAVFVCILAMLVFVSVNQGKFLDVPSNAWYHDSVYRAQSMGIIDGVNAVSFQPNSALSKAECIKLAVCVHQYRADGEITLSGTGAKWYQPYVDYAAANGIVSLPCDHLNKPVTRGEAAHIFAKAIGSEGIVINESTRRYSDVRDEDMPYYDSIYALYRYGIMIGDNTGCFKPDASISRAEAAAVVVRLADELSRVEGEISLRWNVTLPVLMYHDFDVESRDYTTSEETFRSHLEMFRREGYTTITFEELLRYKNGEDNLPTKPILLISDDGYMGVLEYALPLLREYDMNMSVAVIGNLIGDRGEGKLTHFFLEEEATADPEGRIELLSHSYGFHDISEEMNGTANLTLDGDEYLNRIRRDCMIMKDYAAGSHPMMEKVYVYPFGSYSEESEAALAANGYEATVTTERGIAVVSPGCSLGLLPRITAEWYMTGDDLLVNLK